MIPPGSLPAALVGPACPRLPENSCPLAHPRSGPCVQLPCKRLSDELVNHLKKIAICPNCSATRAQRGRRKYAQEPKASSEPTSAPGLYNMQHRETLVLLTGLPGCILHLVRLLCHEPQLCKVAEARTSIGQTAGGLAADTQRAGCWPVPRAGRKARRPFTTGRG